MIRRMPRGQSGITLTEILISILILSIGMVSIATLFPLGLLRLRDAGRMSRSATLTESATADLGVRNLLSKNSFLNLGSGRYYTNSTYTPWPYDPWVQDTPGYTAGVWMDPIAGTAFGAYRGNGSFNIYNPTPHDKAPPSKFIPGPGLPVAYDPLWRTAANCFPGAATEARFASGLGFIRADPNPGGSSNPSAHGLQRITNFPVGSTGSVSDIFVSPEDIVLQSDVDSTKGSGTASPIVPDLSLDTNQNTKLPAPLNDWKYTWMFTGQQADCTNGSVFVGDIVIFENRPFAVDSVSPPFASTPTVTSAVAGETVVEAIFGYTNKVTSGGVGGKVGYGVTANRAVLLRWSDKLPDPEIRVGSWIADVTYERNAAVDETRSYLDPSSGSAGAFYPYQRCYWYQLAKRTEASASQTLTGYREMTVWTSTPLKALTLLNVSDGSPYHVNAGLVAPYVVNVFPRTIYTR